MFDTVFTKIKGFTVNSSFILHLQILRFYRPASYQSRIYQCQASMPNGRVISHNFNIIFHGMFLWWFNNSFPSWQSFEILVFFKTPWKVIKNLKLLTGYQYLVWSLRNFSHTVPQIHVPYRRAYKWKLFWGTFPPVLFTAHAQINFAVECIDSDPVVTLLSAMRQAMFFFVFFLYWGKGCRKQFCLLWLPRAVLLT
jgi:hypothetical protein